MKIVACMCLVELPVVTAVDGSLNYAVGPDCPTEGREFHINPREGFAG